MGEKRRGSRGLTSDVVSTKIKVSSLVLTPRPKDIGKLPIFWVFSSRFLELADDCEYSRYERTHHPYMSPFLYIVQ